MLRIISGVLLATLLTLAGCGSSDSKADSKADACAAWDKAMRADQELWEWINAPDLPDTGDPMADIEAIEASMDDLDKRTNELEDAEEAAKDAFSKAAAEDPEWEDVQAAAYEHLSSGETEGKATVEAACDLITEDS